MRITLKTILKFIAIAFLCSTLSLLPHKTLATLPTIEVDANRIIADVSNNPVGININPILDEVEICDRLQTINIGSIRYPNGELADYYLFDPNNPEKFKLSIKDSNLWFFNLTDPNRRWHDKFSFDDFVNITKSINAEPFVIVGIDAISYIGSESHASPKEVLSAAVEWVKYANIVKGYGIKYWEIGNENDLPSQHLDWTPQKYAETVVKFSQAMKAVDPSIKIGANSMKGSDWWNKILPIIKNDVDFLVTHQYSWMKNYEEWKKYKWDYEYNLQYTKEAVDTYAPDLRINVTEISSFNPSLSQTNNTWKMLHNFEIMGNTLNFNQVDYIHFWTSRWLEQKTYSDDFSAFDSDYKLTPMGYPIHVWGNFIKKQMVYSSQFGDIGSWASYDSDRQSLSLFLLNKDLAPQTIQIKFKNYDCNINNERWILRGSSPNSKKVIWQQSNPIKVNQSKIKTKLDPLSVTVMTFE